MKKTGAKMTYYNCHVGHVGQSLGKQTKLQRSQQNKAHNQTATGPHSIPLTMRGINLTRYCTDLDAIIQRSGT
jgi:hypothetical protein